jgi:hypothetical protein
MRQHGEDGRLVYPKHSLMGLPLRSGSIESVMRIGMKRNGTFWGVPKAERILVLRGVSSKQSLGCGPPRRQTRDIEESKTIHATDS